MKGRCRLHRVPIMGYDEHKYPKMYKRPFLFSCIGLPERCQAIDRCKRDWRRFLGCASRRGCPRWRETGVSIEREPHWGEEGGVASRVGRPRGLCGMKCAGARSGGHSLPVHFVCAPRKRCVLRLRSALVAVVVTIGVVPQLYAQSSCNNGTVVVDPGSNPDLVSDCQALLRAKSAWNNPAILVGDKRIDFELDGSES